MAVSSADRHAALRLSSLLRGGKPAGVAVTTDTGEGVRLTPALLDLLAQAAQLMADGAAVSVLAREEMLTTQQAANLLDVSRQYLVRLLDRGDIPSTKAGTHRRVRASDVEQYRQRRDKGRLAALARMADQAQADGAYDSPIEFGPRRTAPPKGA